MSVIQKIRDKYAAVVIAAIAISLVAFILMDAFQGGGRMFGGGDTLGKINGVKITKGEFDKELEMYRQQGQNSDQLIGQLWQMNVDRIVMQEEYEKTGLAFTNKELSDVLFGANPPQWLQQAFTDPNTGVYNAEQARQAFANMKKAKGNEQAQMVYTAYIKPTIEQSLRSKYLSLISNSAYVPKWLAEKQMADNSQIASISYVYVPYTSLPDSSFKVSDDDINAYVKKHPEEFKVDDDTRQVTYVTFDVVPTTEDSATVRNTIVAAREEFAATKDEEAFLNRMGSEMQYANTYFSKTRIQHAYKDSVTSIGVGQLYGPYVDGGSFVLAKMVGVKNWPDSVKVRHILIGTQNQQTGQVQRDDSTAKKLADSIATAVKNGSNFDSLVAKFSDDKGSVAKGGVYDFFPQGQMVEEFNNFAFDGKAGDKGVVKTQFGYHYIEILGQKNFQPAYKIAYLSKSIVPSQETINAANDQALKFAAESKDQKSFNDNLTKFKKTSLQSPDIKENDFNVGGIGDARTLVRWVYENDLGDISDPFEVDNKYIVAMISNIQKKGLMNAAKARPMAEQYIRNEKKAKQIIANKFKGNTLEAYAQSSGTSIARADSLSFASAAFIPNVGMEPKMAGAAFNKNLRNKASEPIAGATGVFSLRQEMLGATATAANIEQIRLQLVQQMKSSGGFRSAEALKKSAKIKDYRFNFY